MIPEELFKVTKGNPHPMVELLPAIEKDEINPMPGMRAKLLSITPEIEDGKIIYYKAVLDFTGFEDYNKQFDKPVFYNKDGVAKDTWHESLYYPEDGRETIYIDPSDDVLDLITNVPFQKYIESGSKKSYVSWMEETLTDIWTPDKILREMMEDD